MCVETAETEGGDKHTQDRRRGGGAEEAGSEEAEEAATPHNEHGRAVYG